MDKILVLDLGTSFFKSVIYDPEMRVLHENSSPVTSLHPRQEFSEQNPEDLRAIAEENLKSIIVKESNPQDIKAVVFSNAMHSLIPLDENHQPLDNALLWSDMRAGEVVESIKASGIDKQLYIDTGTPAHPMSPLYKILWWKKHKPDLIERTKKFASIKDFLILHWTGQFVTDHTTASATGLFNINTLGWSSTALDLAGVDKEKLPEVGPIHHEVDWSNSEFFKSLNLSPSATIILGATDGCLAQVAGGSKHKEALSLSVGTSAAIRAVSSSPIQDPHGGIFNYFYEKGSYICGGPSSNGGNLIKWMASVFNSNRVDLERFTTAELPKLLEEVEPGANGLFFLPYIHGERAPLWTTDATGSFLFIHHRHHRAHHCRAVIEGMFLNLRMITHILESRAEPLDHIVLSGHLFNIPGLSQLVADIFGRKTIDTGTQNLSAQGAALLGWKHLGVGTAPIETEEREFFPHPETGPIYDQIFSTFEALVNERMFKSDSSSKD